MLIEEVSAARRLRMPRSVYEQMLVHAREVLPREAVGFLGGIGDRVRCCIPLPNKLGERHFLVDPYAQYRALRDLERSGLHALAVYHSHPGGGVGLSEEDLRFARRLPFLQLVIALARPHDPAVEVAAWAVSSSSASATASEAILDLLDS